jgi:hypothetical protein
LRFLRPADLSGTRVKAIDIVASGYVLWDGEGWEITAAGRDFLRTLEAVTQDNRPDETAEPEAGDAEIPAPPPAKLIVVGDRFKARRG